MATGSILKKYSSVPRAIAAGDAPADEGHQSTPSEKPHEQPQQEGSTGERKTSSTSSLENRSSSSSSKVNTESEAAQPSSDQSMYQPRRRSMPGELPSETADEEQSISARDEAVGVTEPKQLHETGDPTELNKLKSSQDTAFAEELNVTPDPIQPPRTPSMTGAIPPNLPLGVPSQISSIAPSSASSRRPSEALPTSRSRKLSRAHPLVDPDVPSARAVKETRASSAAPSDRVRRRSEKSSIAKSARSRAASVGPPDRSQTPSTADMPLKSTRSASSTPALSRPIPQPASRDASIAASVATSKASLLSDAHTSTPAPEKSTNSPQAPGNGSSPSRNMSRKPSQATTIAAIPSHKPSHVSFGGETTAPNPPVIESSEALSTEDATTITRQALASRQVSIYDIAPEFREELLSIVQRMLTEHPEYIVGATPREQANSEGQRGVDLRLEDDNVTRRVISIPQRCNPKARDRFRWVVLAHGAILKLLVGNQMAPVVKEYLRIKAGKEELVRGQYVEDGPPDFAELTASHPLHSHGNAAD